MQNKCLVNFKKVISLFVSISLIICISLREQKIYADDEAFIDIAKKCIDHSDVLSLDLFETSIIRPYVEPTDLFKHIESLYGNNFFDERMKAERQARSSCQNYECNIDDIYECMPYDLKALKQIEINFEKSILRINPEIFEIYNYAIEKGKRIVFVSDMYLQREILEDIIRALGYRDFEKLYVSCEYKENKLNGGLFKRVIEDLSLDPGKTVHIGDNFRSDYQSALNIGLQALHYKNIIQDFFNNPDGIKFSEFYNLQNKDLAGSIISAMAAYRWNKHKEIYVLDEETYWKDFGYSVGGPVVWGFCKFIVKTAIEKGCTDVLLVARDGYNLLKAFEIMGETSIKPHYIYASRAICNACLSDRSSMDSFLSYITGKTDIKQKILMADSCAATYTAQRFLSGIFGSVVGCYFHLWGNYLKDLSVKEFLKPMNRTEVQKINTLVEIIFSSPEPPIINISPTGDPIYKEGISDAESYRIKTSNYISDGILDFARDIKMLFGNDSRDIMDDVCLYKMLCCCLKHFSNNDYMYLSNINYAIDAQHTIYRNCFKREIGLLSWWQEACKTSFWPEIRAKYYDALSTDQALVRSFLPSEVFADQDTSLGAIASIPEAARPWLTPSLPCACTWWQAARKTPQWDEIKRTYLDKLPTDDRVKVLSFFQPPLPAHATISDRIYRMLELTPGNFEKLNVPSLLMTAVYSTLDKFLKSNPNLTAELERILNKAESSDDSLHIFWKEVESSSCKAKLDTDLVAKLPLAIRLSIKSYMLKMKGAIA